MGKELREAHFSLATAKYHAGDFSYVVLIIRLECEADNSVLAML